MSVWIAQTLFATTLLMALVLAVRPLVRRAFGASAAYALWLVPVLTPLLPAFSRPETFRGAVAPMDVVFASAPAAPEGLALLVWIWAAGALLFAGRLVVDYRRFLARTLHGAFAVDAHGQVLLSDAVDGPAAAGLFKRCIFVPRDFETRFTAAERDLALRHERKHLERRDLVANAAALLVLALHWFNPLAYLAYGKFREDQELSCDAAVIAAAKPQERAAYGAAMVKSARGPAAPATTCPMSRPTTLKRRLTMINTHRTNRYAKLGSIASVALVALAGSTLTATSGIAAEPVVKKVTIRVKEVDGVKGVAEALSKEVDAKCGPVTDRFETTAEVQRDGKPGKSVFILCNKAGAPPADRVATLEKVRVNLESNTDVAAEHRGKLIAALDSAIAKLKAGN